MTPVPWPFDGRLFQAVESAAHLPLFFWIGMTLRSGVLPRLRMPHHLPLRMLAVLLAAGAVELLQRYTGRDPDLRDFIVSAAGGCAGVWAAEALYSASRWKPYAAMGSVVLVGLLAVWPVFWVLADRLQATARFPELASFETRSELGRWWFQGVRISRVTQQATEGRHALRVAVRSKRAVYPGLFMTDGRRDWSDCRRLCLDIYLAGARERDLWVRVDDQRDNPPYTDRAQQQIRLSPGLNRICLDLDRLLVTTSGRPLDASTIWRWGLFLDQVHGDEIFFLDNVRLVR